MVEAFAKLCESIRCRYPQNSSSYLLAKGVEIDATTGMQGKPKFDEEMAKLSLSRQSEKDERLGSAKGGTMTEVAYHTLQSSVDIFKARLKGKGPVVEKSPPREMRRLG